jgi:hypothetical protein
MSFHGGGHSIGHSSGRTFSRPSFHRPSHVGRVHQPHRIGHRPTPHRPIAGHHRPDRHHHAHNHHHHHHHKWWAWCHHHHHHHFHRWCGIWFPGVDFTVAVDGSVETTPVATTPAATPVATPVAKDACTCLTKTYLPDGSVLFKDVCTKEMAMATAEELKAQAEGAPPAK